MKNHRIIVTAANHKYFGSLINLIGSIGRSNSVVDQIIVFDLGLTKFEKLVLNNIRRVSIRIVEERQAHFKDVECFAWKVAAIHKTLMDINGGSLLWLDSGIEVVRSVNALFETIEKDGYVYNVSPLDDPNCKVVTLTQEQTFEIMGEHCETYRDTLMVNAGIQGYLKGHSASKVIEEAYIYACDPRVICGPRDRHRHDQSILSILRMRHKLQAQYWLIHEPFSKFEFPFLIPAAFQGMIKRTEQIELSSEAEPIVFSTRTNRPFCNASFVEFRSYDWIYKFLLIFMRILFKFSHIVKLS